MKLSHPRYNEMRCIFETELSGMAFNSLLCLLFAKGKQFEINDPCLFKDDNLVKRKIHVFARDCKQERHVYIIVDKKEMTVLVRANRHDADDTKEIFGRLVKSLESSIDLPI